MSKPTAKCNCFYVSTTRDLHNTVISLSLSHHALSPQNAGVESKGTTSALLDKGAEKSPTKARQPRKVDLRARYWAFLFDNLRRAVDEIYVTCESDQSVVECKVSLLLGKKSNYINNP